MRRNRETAAVALLALGVGLVAPACGGLEGENVGPDADDLAADPLLNIDVDQAETAYETSTQGREGGVAPALNNPLSDATRAWDLETHDWQPILADVVARIDELGVTFWELSCTENLITYRGAKEVETGDDPIVAQVDVVMNTGSEPPRLRIVLAADGTLDSTTPPEGERPARPDDCPADLADEFATLAD